MPRRVLVADDEPLTADMLAMILAFHGYEVICANDGAEALRQVREQRPDIVLLDVIMPELEGVDVARALRSDPELQGVPILLFSSADEHEVDWRDAGANAFLRKPLDIRSLPQLVESYAPPDDDTPHSPDRGGRRAA